MKNPPTMILVNIFKKWQIWQKKMPMCNRSPMMCTYLSKTTRTSGPATASSTSDNTNHTNNRLHTTNSISHINNFRTVALCISSIALNMDVVGTTSGKDNTMTHPIAQSILLFDSWSLQSSWNRMQVQNVRMSR
eukprot:6593151-Ditylum_brightwellii.AAC.2